MSDVAAPAPTTAAAPVKRSVLKRVLAVLLGIVLALVVIVAMQPADFRVVRDIRIAAPAERVFPYLVDFRKGDTWSPWSKLDPDMKQTFEGPDGVGARHSWNGNDKVGAGHQEIVEVIPLEKVRTKLVFERPMQAENEAQFLLRPDGDGTVVTWSMSGKNGFIGKAFGLVVDCDKLVGGDFEKGLANLKQIVEKGE